MSFVRNLFFSVFLGVWGTLSAQEERVIPVPREVLPGTGEFRISEVTAWHTNLSGAEKESLVNYAAAFGCRPVFPRSFCRSPRRRYSGSAVADCR